MSASRRICVTWLIHRILPRETLDAQSLDLLIMCDMTNAYVWYDSFICVTWLIHIRFVARESRRAVTRFADICDVSIEYMRHLSFSSFPHFFLDGKSTNSKNHPLWDMMYSHVRNDSSDLFICANKSVESCLTCEYKQISHLSHVSRVKTNKQVIWVIWQDSCLTLIRLMCQCVAVCCSVLQCVAVCCSVLQCVAVCCSVLQCVAVSMSHTHQTYVSHVNTNDSFTSKTWLVSTIHM